MRQRIRGVEVVSDELGYLKDMDAFKESIEKKTLMKYEDNEVFDAVYIEEDRVMRAYVDKEEGIVQFQKIDANAKALSLLLRLSGDNKWFIENYSVKLVAEDKDN